MSAKDYPLSLDTDLFRKQYFIHKFECDVQRVVDEISIENGFNNIRTKNFLKKRNMFQKGDYFLPLKSDHARYLLCLEEKVHEKFSKIPYILNSEIDSVDNLIVNLNRPVIYRFVLHDVLGDGAEYAMSKPNSSVLVVIHNGKLKDFDNMRISIIAHHIISFLLSNNFEVYSNEYKLFTKTSSSPTAVKLVCSDSCKPINYYKKLKELAHFSEFKKECLKLEDCVCLDCKKVLESHSILAKYDKCIKDIKLSSENETEILTLAAYIEHLLEDHIVEKPKYVFHIVLNSQRNVVYESGLLLEMLSEIQTTQMYFVVQSTHIKANSEMSCNDFVLGKKQEIANAMAHKYGFAISEDKEWAYRIETLVDSAIKFNVLKVSPNMLLKLNIPSNQSIVGKNTGIFVQYNFARLSNLFKNFETKVKECYYKPLPSLEEVNFELLKLEEEWNLFGYVLSFPKIVQGLLDSFVLQKNSKSYFPTNRICIMLSELCHHLSIYYSKIRILGGQQPQLQNLMHARLWLLKAIYKVMSNSFRLLNIQGLDQM